MSNFDAEQVEINLLHMEAITLALIVVGFVAACVSVIVGVL